MPSTNLHTSQSFNFLPLAACKRRVSVKEASRFAAASVTASGSLARKPQDARKSRHMTFVWSKTP